jgi:hypothetical protein
MRKILIFLLLCYWNQGFSLSSQEAKIIGEKIWKNECGGKKEGLTHWNKGENFASLGIGHFIWYPAEKNERFQETFPDLLQFLQKEKINLPPWLKAAAGCPWSSREEFYHQIQSPEMESLRKMLFDTRSLQAIFMAHRLETLFPQIVASCPPREREKITVLFKRLTEEGKGWYALIDYLNFKGAGISPQETYQGKGWGLLQVLEGMPSSSKRPLEDFVAAAKAVLIQRVQNASPERDEARWLPGWLNRLDTYLP